MRVTYRRQAEKMASEINAELLRQGADTFCLLRSNHEGAWIGGSTVRAEQFWLSFTRQTDGSLMHTTSVFANTPKDACRYLKGYLDATYWQNGKA